MGSVYALIDSQGKVTGRTAYDPYGNITYQTGAQPIMAYAGLYQHKESGLHRAYNSATARWLNRDPIREAGGLNVYAYAGGNPVNYTDPLGLDVYISIDRVGSTEKSISGTITVSSTAIKSTFSGYTLENRSPPNINLPVSPGTYSAFIRNDHSPSRIELYNVPNASNIQIHVGNNPQDVVGCFAVGTSQAHDFVSGSKKAMQAINSIISQDGTGIIKVTINEAP